MGCAAKKWQIGDCARNWRKAIGQLRLRLPPSDFAEDRHNLVGRTGGVQIDLRREGIAPGADVRPLGMSDCVSTSARLLCARTDGGLMSRWGKLWYFWFGLFILAGSAFSSGVVLAKKGFLGR